MTDSPYIAILAWIGGVCSFTLSSLQAAEPVKRHVDFRAEEHTQVAPVTVNAAFLANMLVPKVSYFEVAGQKQNGKFINASQSDDSFAYRISAGSYYQLNKRVMLYGAIDYTSFTGQNMSGSAFIQSGMTPFDIVEADDANKGRKRLESLPPRSGYRLYGSQLCQAQGPAPQEYADGYAGIGGCQLGCPVVDDCGSLL